MADLPHTPATANTQHKPPTQVTLPDGTFIYSSWDADLGWYIVNCDLCGHSISLTSTGNQHAFNQHRGKKACQVNQRRWRMRQEVNAAASSLNTWVGPGSSSASGRASGSTRIYGMTPSYISNSPASVVPSCSSTPSRSSRPLPTLSMLPTSSAISTPFSATPITTAPPSRSPSPSSLHGYSSSSESGIGEEPSQDSEARECTGALVEWEAGSVWDTYPYHLHEHRSVSYPWEPIAFENRKWLRLRSSECSLIVTGLDLLCDSCRQLPHSERFRNFLARAKDTSEHTAWMYLTQKQLLMKCVKLKAQNRRLQLEVLYISSIMYGCTQNIRSWTRT